MTDDEWDKGHRAKWMTQAQWECAQIFRDLFRGWHHLPTDVKPFDNGVSIIAYDDLATWDYDHLTRLVILCHDRCIRASIRNGGPRRLKIILFKRKGRDGAWHDRHPTIEEAIRTLRKIHPSPEERQP